MTRRILTLCLALAVASTAAAEEKSAKVDPKAVQDVVYLGDAQPLLIRLHVTIDGKPFRTKWTEFVDQVFDYLDLDGDGALAKGEAARVPPAQVLLSAGFYGFGPQGVPAATGLDADKDGKVTRAELAAHYRKTGAPAFTLRGLDTGGQFRVVQEQAAAVYRAGGSPGPASDAINKAFFTLLDADQDGRLSKDELTAGVARLLKRDASDDEMLTSEELLGDVAPEQTGVRVFAPGMAGAPTPPQVPFFVVDPDDKGAELAKRLIERYAPKGTKTVPASTKAFAADAFEHLDANADGELDAGELARFASTAPHLEVAARLGKREKDQPAIERTGGSSPKSVAISTAKDGAIVLDLGVTRIELGGPPPSGGPSPFQVRIDNQYKSQFKTADADANGYLDEKEAKGNPIFSGVMKIMDRDGDGMLFEKELDAYLAKVKDLQGAASAGCSSLSAGDQGKGVFDLLDADRDGRLSVREMRKAPELVKRLDRDADATVTTAEVPKSYQVRVQQGGATFGPSGVAAVAITQGMTTQTAPETGPGPVWHRKMDRNRDGDVSRREFLGKKEDFRTIDADGDELISREEAEAADKRYRTSAQK